MTIRESQNEFIEELGMFDSWSDKFNLLIEKSNFQLKEVPEELCRYRISNCQSRTYFKAENINGYININGWSNSSVMSGLIDYIKNIFNGYAVWQLTAWAIDFHIKSDLINNLTPMRRAALEEIIHRIIVLSSPK